MLKITKGEGSEAKSGTVVKVEDSPGYHYVQKTIGSDTWLVMAQSQVELEDEWASLYYTTQNQSNIFLQPPFDPTAMLNLTQSNNVLNQCIEAMEVNIDGTGFDFDPVDGVDEVDPEEEKIAQGFFNEPYPEHSFIKIRRKLRRQIESIGYGFLEILRNIGGEVVGFRNVETHNVRMVKLDAPIMVKKTVTRNGKDVELQMWVRERRFAQRVALKTLVYYREFGTTRNVNRNTGAWETPDAPIPVENQGTELMMFGVVPDIITPYFVPRWTNQMPSVVGSRKAEEQNLQFLDSGGMPPAIIFVQGGVLVKDAADQLRAYLSGQNKEKYRAVVVEAQSSSGSLDAAGNVQVRVERFGSEKANDAMYMNYDKATEEHVRVGFRLPPLFLGKPQDYNLATAVTAYMVAEAQTFQPERDVFDDQINKTIVKALGLKTLKLHSKPITLRDIGSMLSALGIAKDLSTRDSVLDEINQMTGMKLVLAPQPQPDTVSGQYTPPQTDENGNQVTAGGRPIPGTAPQQPAAPPQQEQQASAQRGQVQKPQFAQGTPSAALPPQQLPTPKGSAKPQGAGKVTPPPAPKAAAKKAIELIELAHDYASMKGLVSKREITPQRELLVKEEIEDLLLEDREAFNRLLATYTFGGDSADLVGITAQLNER